MRRTTVLALILLPAVTLAGDPPADFAYNEARSLGTLDDRDVKESSGVACSHVQDGRFWTHNDSGDRPRVFAFDREGKTRCLEIEGADFNDWEDMASFEKDGKPWLLLADTGDNEGMRGTVVLYLVEEPRALPPREVTRASLPLAGRLELRYEGGESHDCEGVGVDVVSGLILLVTKVRRGDERPTVYSAPLHALWGASKEIQVARKVAELQPAVPLLTTSLDVSPDGRRLVVLSYGDAYGYVRGADEEWSRALTRTPVRITLPKRPQGESIAFERDGRSLILTSEGKPCPVWELPAR